MLPHGGVGRSSGVCLPSSLPRRCHGTAARGPRCGARTGRAQGPYQDRVPDATFRMRPRPVGAVRSAGIVADGRTLRRVPRNPPVLVLVRPHNPVSPVRESPVVAAQSFRPARPARLVVLVSGSGTNLQALLDAIAAAGSRAYGARGRGRRRRPRRYRRSGACRAGRNAHLRVPGQGLRHPRRSGTRHWPRRRPRTTPDLVVSAGFMKIVGHRFLARFGGRFVNTHPALLPSFPGAHGVRDALAYGAKVTGCTVHFVDDGVDTGPIIAQGVVEVRDEDYTDEVPLCTSASRKSSDGCSSRSWGVSPATATASRDRKSKGPRLGHE